MNNPVSTLAEVKDNVGGTAATEFKVVNLGNANNGNNDYVTFNVSGYPNYQEFAVYRNIFPVYNGSSGHCSGDPADHGMTLSYNSSTGVITARNNVYSYKGEHYHADFNVYLMY